MMSHRTIRNDDFQHEGDAFKVDAVSRGWADNFLHNFYFASFWIRVNNSQR